MNHLLLSKCVWCISFLGDSELQWSRNHHMGWEKYQSLASFMWRYFTYHHILSLAACCNFVSNGRGTPLHKLHIGGTHQWSAGQTNTVMRLPMLHCHMSLEDGDSAKWWGHGNNPNNSFSVYVLIKTTAIVAFVHCFFCWETAKKRQDVQSNKNTKQVADKNIIAVNSVLKSLATPWSLVLQLLHEKHVQSDVMSIVAFFSGWVATKKRTYWAPKKEIYTVKLVQTI